MFPFIQNEDVETFKQYKKAFKIAGELNKKVHVLHISTKDEIELLNSHKNSATCEATPQHLFLSLLIVIIS